MSRRVGSARAENTRESGSAATASSSVFNLAVDGRVPCLPPVVNPSVEEESGPDAGREAGVVDDQPVVVDRELEGPVPLVAVPPPWGRQSSVGLVPPGRAQLGNVDPGPGEGRGGPDRQSGEPVDRKGV